MYSRAIKRVIFVVSLSLSFSTHPKGRFSHIKKLVRRVLRAFGASASTTTTTLPLAFGGGDDDGGGDHAFLSSFFFRPSPCIIVVIVFSGTESRSRENHRF